MKNMRKILAAILAVMMVLAMMPAAFAADTTYTLDIATLEDVAQGSKADGDTLPGEYFTVVFSAKTRIESNSKSFEDGFEAGKRLNFGGNTVIGAEGNKNAVKFTTSGAATIKVWWVSGGDGREVAIYNEAGEVLTQTTIGSVKNSLYVSELTVDAAGTYYVGNVDGNNNYYKLEATEAAAASADPAANSTLSVADAIALGASKEHNTYTEGKYYVTGVITEVYNTQYGNMKIADEAGNILTVYGTYDADGTNRYDAMATKPVAGDTVTVYGIIGQYNNAPQIKNGWITSHTAAAPETPAAPVEPETPTESTDPAADSTLSVADAIALGASKEHNTYTEGKYYVTGVITEVYNEKYGNMKIADEAGNILTIYGTYDADGTNRYDAMATKPVAGDTVTVYGIIGQYNNTPQIKNGWITTHTPAAPVDPDPVDPTPDAPAGIQYTVKAGDTLGKIALAHYGLVEKYQAIFEANRGILTSPNMIYVGQVLTLPGENLLTTGEGETLYTIQPGDTLGTIALNWYGTMSQYKVIFERNSTHLANPNLIYAGQVIVLPAK